jgi:hypothetical protein
MVVYQQNPMAWHPIHLMLGPNSTREHPDEQGNLGRRFPIEGLSRDRHSPLDASGVRPSLGLAGDGLRLELLGLGEREGQDAVLEVGLGLVGDDDSRERKGAGEAPESAFAQVVGRLFLGLLLLDRSPGWSTGRP